MKACLDHVTPAQRLAPHAEHKNCTTLEEANAYLDANYLSVLRHGFTPTPSHSTDVRATMDRRHPTQVAQRDTPVFLRRQAA
jgi:hypothetical protein